MKRRLDLFFVIIDLLMRGDKELINWLLLKRGKIFIHCPLKKAWWLLLMKETTDIGGEICWVLNPASMQYNVIVI